MNILFSYRYRDGANYKQNGEVVFSNLIEMSIETIDSRIRNCLWEGEWFYAEQWGLPDLHLFDWDNEIDHLLHEYDGVADTGEPHSGVDITDILKRIETVI